MNCAQHLLLQQLCRVSNDIAWFNAYQCERNFQAAIEVLSENANGVVARVFHTGEDARWDIAV